MSKQLTLGETAAVEELARQPIENLNDPTAPKGKLLAALVTVLKRREAPGFTLDEAFAMPADEAGALVEQALGSPDPT